MLVEDPQTWVRSWRVAFPLRRDDSYVIYGSACHEGNYALANVLRAAHAADRAGAGSSKTIGSAVRGRRPDFPDRLRAAMAAIAAFLGRLRRVAESSGQAPDPSWLASEIPVGWSRVRVGRGRCPRRPASCQSAPTEHPLRRRHPRIGWSPSRRRVSRERQLLERTRTARAMTPGGRRPTSCQPRREAASASTPHPFPPSPAGGTTRIDLTTAALEPDVSVMRNVSA